MKNLRQIFWTMIVFVVMKMGINAETDQDNFLFQHHGEFPKDCQDVKDACTENEDLVSGVYVIKPEGSKEPFEVFCDHETDGGGWTVFQRRQDHSINFARPWQYYKEGFGFLNQEFWLGNDKLSYLTNQRKYMLRIDFEPSRQQWVQYNDFQISDEKGSYSLIELGDFSAPRGLGDIMRPQEHMPFSTSDRLFTESNCARNHNAGGWWFSSGCARPNLNGDYSCSQNRCFHWRTGTPSLTFSEMKIKPADFV